MARWGTALGLLAVPVIGATVPGGAQQPDPAFAKARAYWAEGASAPAFVLNSIQARAAKYLVAAETSANRGTFSKAISELDYLSKLPETDDSNQQIATAKSDTTLLDRFFGTPGLYVSSSYWPKATPLSRPTCGSKTQMLLLWDVADDLTVTLTYQRASVHCGGPDDVQYNPYGPKLKAALAVDAPVFTLNSENELARSSDYLPPGEVVGWFHYSASGSTITALTQVFHP